MKVNHLVESAILHAINTNPEKLAKRLSIVLSPVQQLCLFEGIIVDALVTNVLLLAKCVPAIRKYDKIVVEDVGIINYNQPDGYNIPMYIKVTYTGILGDEKHTEQHNMCLTDAINSGAFNFTII